MNDQASFPAGVSLPRALTGAPALPARVLVDLPNWLGDLVMAMPATDRLIQANQGGTTILHVRHASARLVSAIFPEAEVIHSARGENPLRTVRRFRQLGPRADIGLTMRNAGRAKVILRMVSRWSTGTASQGGRSLLNWAYKPDFERHQIHDADPALTRLGLEGADQAWRAPMPGSLAGLGRGFLREAGVGPDTRPVGLAPGVASGGSAKQWPEEHFGRLASLLKAGGFEPVVVIGPGEAAIAQSVVEASGLNLPVLAEDLDAAGLAAVLSGLSVLVGNDSGPAHLASALGVATVALFGPTDEGRTAPMAPDGVVLRCQMECAPCDRTTCPLVHQACLRDLDPMNVFEAVVGQVDRESIHTSSPGRRCVQRIN